MNWHFSIVKYILICKVYILYNINQLIKWNTTAPNAYLKNKESIFISETLHCLQSNADANILRHDVKIRLWFSSWLCALYFYDPTQP